ncbi:MAG: hypothetical protein AAB354_02365, partial [candidate division KSB1 bacterium]
MKPPAYPEYKSKLRALIVEYGRRGILTGETPLRFVPSDRIPPQEGGVVLAMNPQLNFQDGATLSVLEEARIVNDQAVLLRYSYHYERPGGYFFRYEREESDDLIRKPEYHMHVFLNL